MIYIYISKKVTDLGWNLVVYDEELSAFTEDANPDIDTNGFIIQKISKPLVSLRLMPYLDSLSGRFDGEQHQMCFVDQQKYHRQRNVGLNCLGKAI